MFSQSSLITEAQINVPVNFSFIQMTGHQLMLQTVKFSRRASWLWAHPPSALPSAPYSCYQLAGLFTWPRVTDSQPHVWSLETDKASTSTYLTQDFMTPSMFLSAVCVCVVCVSVCYCGDNPCPKHRQGPAFSVYKGLDQSTLSVQPVSRPDVWSYINCRQAVGVCVHVMVCVPSQ